MEHTSFPRYSTTGIWLSANRSWPSRALSAATGEVTAMPDVAPNPENVGRGAWFRNQVSKPPGILPKNAQTWVIAGLSAVMITAIAISGNGSRNKPPAVHPREATIIDPNAARITEYRNRLEEETQRLADEQAQLNQAKRALEVDQ